MTKQRNLHYNCNVEINLILWHDIVSKYKVVVHLYNLTFMYFQKCLSHTENITPQKL